MNAETDLERAMRAAVAEGMSLTEACGRIGVGAFLHHGGGWGQDRGGLKIPIFPRHSGRFPLRESAIAASVRDALRP